ncbi:purine-nucleoside phosphorylase [Thermodesulfobacteriota bacterium]
MKKQVEESLESLGVGKIPGETMSLILGSGWGGFVDEMEVAWRRHYGDIAHFPRSSVPGHKGELVFGESEGKKVIVLNGRVHSYEGLSLAETAYPVDVLAALGCARIVITNAVGAVNEGYDVGDFMLIRDHINFMRENPLTGRNTPEQRDPFVDMKRAYAVEIYDAVAEKAEREGIRVHQGVLAAVSGPCYETDAELEMFRRLGADVMSMSTVPEVILARYHRMKVAGVSLITNLARPGAEPVSHEEVLDAADSSREKMKTLLHLICANL